jgi:ABC-type methionine transport system ATPase subunit|tara:strand:+ start:1323 stop:1571 length:249 start_codon:yes stop_codon:yes gene_type:complete
VGLETRRLRLLFSEQLIKEPIIFQVSNLFDVIPNILKADIHEEGWVLLDLSGEPRELEKALLWLFYREVKIELMLEIEIEDI